MTQLSDINWNIVKFQYEMLGYTLIELMAEYDVSESVMKYQSRNWVQLPVSQREELNFIRTGDIDELTEDVVRQVRNETNLISLAKQKELFPLYVKLEHILLAKSVAIAQGLPEDSSSISAIGNLLGTLHKLIEKNPIINPQPERGGGRNYWTAESAGGICWSLYRSKCR